MAAREHIAAKPQSNCPGDEGRGMNGRGMKAGKPQRFHSLADHSSAISVRIAWPPRIFQTQPRSGEFSQRAMIPTHCSAKIAKTEDIWQGNERQGNKAKACV
jgi:hypothetical protein